MDSWVAQGQQRYGPYTQERLAQMLGSGQIAPNARVWVPETKQWIIAAELPGYQRPGAAAEGPQAPTPGTPAPYAPPGAPEAPEAPAASSSASPPEPASGAAPYTPPPASPYAGAPYAGAPYAGAPYAAAPYEAVAGTGGTGQQSQNNSVALASLIVGILGFLSLVLLITIVLAPVPGVLGILAIVLGFVGRSQIKRTGQRGGGLAIGGIVTGIVTLLALAALAVLLVFGLARFGQEVGAEVNRACASAVQVDLRNAAMAQEVIFVSEQAYTTEVAVLARNGWTSEAQPANCASQPLTIQRANSTGFCMQMAGGGQTFAITNNEGLREGTC